MTSASVVASITWSMRIISGRLVVARHQADLKEHHVFVEQRGCHRARHDLFAVEPDLDQTFLGIARPQDMHSEIVPAAGREHALFTMS